jgi:hypothetical protein
VSNLSLDVCHAQNRVPRDRRRRAKATSRCRGSFTHHIAAFTPRSGVDGSELEYIGVNGARPGQHQPRSGGWCALARQVQRASMHGSGIENSSTRIEPIL